MFYVYRIINNINNKQYIGARHYEGNPKDDKYMGSGKYLLQDLRKYGINNFTKQIIFTQLSIEEAYGVEAFLVDKNYVKREDTYNIRTGGSGGGYLVGIKRSDQTRKKLGQSLKGKTNHLGHKHSKQTVEKFRLARVNYWKERHKRQKERT